MKAPSARLRRVVLILALPLSVLTAGALIWQSSYSAFTADTRNSGNSWSTGTVALADDDAGAARFNVTTLVPDQTDTQCIKVTATSTVPGTVKMYTLNPAFSGSGLETHILVTLTAGAGGSFASCTGFVADGPAMATNVSLADLATSHNSYATAVGSWVTTGNPAGESKTYQITWTFDTTGLTQTQLDALQGAHAGIDFEWEIQSN